MIFCPTPALAPEPPPPLELASSLEGASWIALALLCSGSFELLRAALLYSRVPRVLARLGSEAARDRMQRLLARADGLMTSAAILKIACDLAFLVLLLGWVAGGRGELGWPRALGALAIAVPVLLLGTETLPIALARRHGDAVLVRALPAFAWLELPLRAVVAALETSRRAILRMVRVPEESPSERQIVEGLREVVQDSGRERDLDETERELIENVMEIRDVDVAAVMTPRTEIDGVEIGEGLAGVVRLAADKGRSRVPIYEGSLDSIVGYVPAHAVVQILALGDVAKADLRDHLRPVYFVPETKRLSELLVEFRRERQKLAIVLDEYGGTAGLVTMGDVLTEIVGEIQDEFDGEEPEAFREIEPGVALVDASLHVSEVNELFGLSIPEEEDFETLAGFTLSELGHFPKRGETFVHGAVEYEVVEATDRRVVRLRVRKPEHQLSS